MNKETTKNIRLGVFVITGIALLITGLYFIGSNRNMFGSTVTLYAQFKNVNGLQKGNNVRYSGIDVGTVEGIEIVNDTTIRVEMTIDADLKRVIRKNSLATLGNDGLMGNKLVNIDPGTPDGEPVTDGDELLSTPALELDEMLRTLDVTNKNVAVISANLRTLTDNINSSRGTLYKVMMDTTLALKINNVIDNIEVLSHNVLVISEDLGDVITEVKSGKGVLGTLVNDTVITTDLTTAIKEVKTAGQQINVAALELKEILQKANSGSGTISTLVNDTATSNSVKRSLINIENSTRNFNLNMEALKHNFLLRGYFKKQEKKRQKEGKTK